MQMPPQYSIDQRVRAIHAALVAAGYGTPHDPSRPTEGQVIARSDFDSALVKVMPELSTETIRRYTDAGRVRGLWVVLRNGSARGSLRILNPKRRTEAEAEGAEA